MSRTRSSPSPTVGRGSDVAVQRRAGELATAADPGPRDTEGGVLSGFGVGLGLGVSLGGGVGVGIGVRLDVGVCVGVGVGTGVTLGVGHSATSNSMDS